jgi:hypothetical protein
MKRRLSRRNLLQRLQKRKKREMTQIRFLVLDHRMIKKAVSLKP